MGRLTGKIAIVTGAGSGIGFATGKLMASEGAIVAAADINYESAERLAEEIKSSGGKAMAILVDVTNEESIKEMVEKVKETYGKIDVLHNNAGDTKRSDKDVVSMDLNTWNYALDVNLTGVMLGCKHVIPVMIENGGGAIINTVSIDGIHGDISVSGYGAAKAGAISLTRYVAIQYGKQNIRCNAIAPGIIATSAAEARIPKELWDMYESHVALPRNGMPEDIGQAAVFLASEESSFITGQTIVVDGGLIGHTPAYSDLIKIIKEYKSKTDLGK